MRKAIISLLLFLLLLAAPTGIRYVRFYELGAAGRQPPPVYDPAGITAVPTPPANTFVDEPAVGAGLVLLDRAHDNQFELEEISFLDGRLAARGFELLEFTGGDLATALRAVNAFIVIAPLQAFDLAEVQAVTQFVNRGGRLLLVGDPTRFAVQVEEDDFMGFVLTIDSAEIPLNSLANEFDIIFNGDYLYNTLENEGNFRNIILNAKGFAGSALTDGLDRLVFYSTNSLQVGARATAVLTADDNTWSSATDRAGGLAPAAASRDGRVLALGDVHIFTQPYYTVYDNSQFITRIADFLTDTAERRFVIQDFPFFYTAPVQLIYTGAPALGPGAFDEIIGLQQAFRGVGQTLLLAGAPAEDADSLYVGLYNQADDVRELLETAGIALTIEPPILPPGADAAEEPAGDTADPEAAPQAQPVRLIQSALGDVQMSGSALILLAETENGRRSVVVLAASAQGLENTIGRLLNGVSWTAADALSDCLLQDTLALCPTAIADEPVEAELITLSAPKAPPEGEEGRPEPPADLDAVEQGVLTLDEPVTAELAPAESHAWLFSDGPLYLDVTVEPDPDLDIVLELYGPGNVLLDVRDRGVRGQSETLPGVEIAANTVYTIVVRDYFDEGGAYTLTVTAGEAPQALGGGGIFIFGDDDGEPIGEGFVDVDTLAALLSDTYTVTTWITTQNGPLTDVNLRNFDLVIWDSGDYQDLGGFLGADAGVILEYLDDGGNIFVLGASPTVFGPLELAPISNLQVTGNDPLLLEGLTPGELIPLDQVYTTALSEVLGISDLAETPFLLRGPEEAGAGNVVGLASVETTLSNQKSIFLFVPLKSLPPDKQRLLVGNILNWFGLSAP
jgi:hypothetical protein